MKVFRAVALALLVAAPAHAGQGVSDDEVVVGSVSDLSGPSPRSGRLPLQARRWFSMK